MAFRTTGISSAGNRFTVTALTVLAYQHFAVFAIDSQKFFAALRTYFICKIVVAERALPVLDLIYNLTCLLYTSRVQGTERLIQKGNSAGT